MNAAARLVRSFHRSPNPRQSLSSIGNQVLHQSTISASTGIAWEFPACKPSIGRSAKSVHDFRGRFDFGLSSWPFVTARSIDHSAFGIRMALRIHGQRPARKHGPPRLSSTHATTTERLHGGTISSSHHDRCVLLSHPGPTLKPPRPFRSGIS